MSSFLDKIKGVAEEDRIESSGKDKKREKKPVGFIQLDVDVVRTDEEFIIHALVPGVQLEDLDIAVEEDNDIVTIQGKRLRPAETRNAKDSSKKNEDLDYVRQELAWGPFYRQIILPQEVNVNGVEARLNKGVLTIKLPLLKIDGKGKKKITIKV